MWGRITGKSQEKSNDTPSGTSRRKEDGQRRRPESTVSSISARKPPRGDDRDRGFDPREEQDRDDNRTVKSERKRERSTSKDRKRDRKDRSRSRDRSDDKRDRREKRERKKDKDREKDRGLSRSESGYNNGQSQTRAGPMPSNESGTFSAQLGGSGFTQFPGQYDGGMPGFPSTPAHPPAGMSAHVPDQFPGQFPMESAAPYRPPLSVSEGGVGLAADYYGDTGESVAHQPGVRPQPPSVIVGAQPHLQSALAVAAPPLEPSATGGIGAAASFFSGSDNFQSSQTVILSNTTGQQRPGKPSQHSDFSGPAMLAGGVATTYVAGAFGQTVNSQISPSNSNVPSLQQGSILPTASFHSPNSTIPSNGYHSTSVPPISTLGAVATGAAAGYMIGSHSSSHEQSSMKPQAIGDTYGGSTTTNSQQPFTHVEASASSFTTNGERPASGNRPSGSSNNHLYTAGLAGAAGLAAAAYHNDHHTSAQNSNSMQQPSGLMAQKHRHDGPFDKFVDFWRDVDGVAQFEEYTEYIGVCRYCFAPGSSPRDAPRKHYYRRRGSNERYGSSVRVDKENRYSSSDGESRRKNNKSWLATGIAGYGLAKVGKSLFAANHDFEDTYNVKSGRMNQSKTSLNGRRHSLSPDRTSRISHGVVKGSSNSVSHRPQSRERVKTSITNDGKIYKKESHGENFSGPTTTTYATRHRSRSRSRDKQTGLAEAAVGMAIGSSVLASNVRKPNNAPSKAFVGSNHRSREQSPEHDTNNRSRKQRNRHDDRSPRHSPSASYVDVRRSDARHEPSISGAFFSSASENRRGGKQKKKQSSFLGLGNSSSSSIENGLAFGAGTDLPRTKKQTKIGSQHHKNASSALIGLGAAAAVLAANEVRKDSRGKRRSDVVAVKEVKGNHNRASDHSYKGTLGPTYVGAEDDLWESASEDDDALSVDSTLAYGLLHRGSQESLRSDSSGTGKWNWRWGSKKEKRKAAPKHHDFATAGAAAGLAGVGAVAVLASYEHEHRPITTNTGSLPPLQHVYPISTSDPAHFDAIMQPSIVSTSQPLMTSRPGVIPLQQPQPIAQVQHSVYTTQAPYGHSYSAPQIPYPQPGTISSAPHCSAESKIPAIMPGSFPSNEYSSENVTRKVTEVERPRRRDSSPTFSSKKSEKRRYTSLHEDTPGVKFDLVTEREEEERRNKQHQKREEGNILKEAKRWEEEEQNQVEEERKRKRRQKRDQEDILKEAQYRELEEQMRIDKDRRTKETIRQEGEDKMKLEEDNERELERLRRQKPESKPEKTNSQAVPTLIGVASALVGASIVEESSNDAEARCQRRRAERRRDGEYQPAFESERPQASSSDSSKQAARIESQARIARQAAAKIRNTPSPVHEDYAAYFTPTELLSKSQDEIQKFGPNSDSEISFQVAHVITIEPSNARGPSSSVHYSFPEPDDQIDLSRITLPWHVPRLNLIEPTPPHSIAGSTKGDTSPTIQAKDVKNPDIQESSKSRSNSRVRFGESETREFDVVSPTDLHEDITEPFEVERNVNPELAQVESESKTRSQEDVAPKEAISVDHIPGEFGDDLDFAATVAAGLEDTGFNPSIVIDDPSFRRRESPPGSEQPSFYHSPFFETVTSLAQGLPSAVDVQPMHGFIEGELPPTPIEEHNSKVADELTDKAALQHEEAEKQKRDQTTHYQSGDEQANFEILSRSPNKVRFENFDEVDFVAINPSEVNDSSNGFSKAKKAKSKRSKRKELASDPFDAKSTIRKDMDRDEYFDASESSRTMSKMENDDFDDDAVAVPLPADGKDDFRSPTESRGPLTSIESSDIRELYESPSEDANSTAASAPVPGAFEESRKPRKKSKRRTSDFDDMRSSVSSPTTFNETKDSNMKAKKEKKGGLFGLFSKSTEDVSDKIRSKDRDVKDPKEKSTKQRDRRSMRDDDDFYDGYSRHSESVDNLPLADEKERGGKSHKSRDKDEKRRIRKNDRMGGDSGRITQELPAKVHMPAFPDLFPDTLQSHSLTNPEHRDDDYPEADSALSQIGNGPKQEKLPMNDADEPLSFLGERQEQKKPPDEAQRVLFPKDGFVLEISKKQLTDSENLSSHEESLPPVPNSQPTTPTSVGRLEDLPMLPTSRSISPLKTSSEPSRRLSDASHPNASSTAIPLFVRRPMSAGFSRSSPSTPAASTHTAEIFTPKPKQGRPLSNEFRFKSSTEFRPLWLVERHSTRQDSAQDEILPSLPSSHSTSRASSIHDPDNERFIQDSESSPASRSEIAIEPPFHAISTQRDSSPELLDSQQATPTADSFQNRSEMHLEAKDPQLSRLDYTLENSNAGGSLDALQVADHPERITHSVNDLFPDPRSKSPSMYRLERHENLPSLPISRASSPYDEDYRSNLLSMANDAAIGALAGGFMLGSAHSPQPDQDILAPGDAFANPRAITAHEDVDNSEIEMEHADGPDVFVSTKDNKKNRKKQGKGSKSFSGQGEALQSKISPASAAFDSGVKTLSYEEQGRKEVQDAQDAVDSWFASDSPKKGKKGKKGKGKGRDPDILDTVRSAATSSNVSTKKDFESKVALPKCDVKAKDEASSALNPEPTAGVKSTESENQTLLRAENQYPRSEDLLRGLFKPEAAPVDILDISIQNSPERSAADTKVEIADQQTFPQISQTVGRSNGKNNAADLLPIRSEKAPSGTILAQQNLDEKEFAESDKELYPVHETSLEADVSPTNIKSDQLNTTEDLPMTSESYEQGAPESGLNIDLQRQQKFTTPSLGDLHSREIEQQVIEPVVSLEHSDEDRKDPIIMHLDESKAASIAKGREIQKRRPGDQEQLETSKNSSTLIQESDLRADNGKSQPERNLSKVETPRIAKLVSPLSSPERISLPLDDDLDLLDPLPSSPPDERDLPSSENLDEVTPDNLQNLPEWIALPVDDDLDIQDSPPQIQLAKQDLSIVGKPYMTSGNLLDLAERIALPADDDFDLLDSPHRSQYGERSFSNLESSENATPANVSINPEGIPLPADDDLDLLSAIPESPTMEPKHQLISHPLVGLMDELPSAEHGVALKSPEQEHDRSHGDLDPLSEESNRDLPGETERETQIADSSWPTVSKPVEDVQAPHTAPIEEIPLFEEVPSPLFERLAQDNEGDYFSIPTNGRTKKGKKGRKSQPVTPFENAALKREDGYTPKEHSIGTIAQVPQIGTSVDMSNELLPMQPVEDEFTQLSNRKDKKGKKQKQKPRDPSSVLFEEPQKITSSEYGDSDSPMKDIKSPSGLLPMLEESSDEPKEQKSNTFDARNPLRSSELPRSNDKALTIADNEVQETKHTQTLESITDSKDLVEKPTKEDTRGFPVNVKDRKGKRSKKPKLDPSFDDGNKGPNVSDPKPSHTDEVPLISESLETQTMPVASNYPFQVQTEDSSRELADDAEWGLSTKKSSKKGKKAKVERSKLSMEEDKIEQVQLSDARNLPVKDTPGEAHSELIIEEDPVIKDVISDNTPREDEGFSDLPSKKKGKKSRISNRHPSVETQEPIITQAIVTEISPTDAEGSSTHDSEDYSVPKSKKDKKNKRKALSRITSKDLESPPSFDEPQPLSPSLPSEDFPIIPTLETPGLRDSTFEVPTFEEPSLKKSSIGESIFREPILGEHTPQEPTAQEPTPQEPTPQEPTPQEPTAQEYTAQSIGLEQPAKGEFTVEDRTLGEHALQEPALQTPTLGESALVQPTPEEPTVRDFIPERYESTNRGFDEGIKIRHETEEGVLHDQPQSQVVTDSYYDSSIRKETLDLKPQDQYLEQPFSALVHDPRFLEQRFLDEASKAALPPDNEDEFTEAHATGYSTPRYPQNPLHFGETRQEHNFEDLPQDENLQEAPELISPPEEAHDSWKDHTPKDEGPVYSINDEISNHADMLLVQRGDLHSSLQHHGPSEDRVLQEAIMSTIPVDTRDDFPEAQPEPVETTLRSPNTKAMSSQETPVLSEFVQSPSLEDNILDEAAASILPEDDSDDFIENPQVEPETLDGSQQSQFTTSDNEVGEKRFKESSHSNILGREKDAVLTQYMDAVMEEWRTRASEASNKPPNSLQGSSSLQLEEVTVPELPEEPKNPPESKESTITQIDVSEPVIDISNVKKSKEAEEAEKVQSFDLGETMETTTPQEIFSVGTELPARRITRDLEVSVDTLQAPENPDLDFEDGNTFSLKKNKKDKKKAKKAQALSWNDTSESLLMQDDLRNADPKKDPDELVNEDLSIVGPENLDSTDPALAETEPMENRSTEMASFDAKKGKKDKKKSKKAQAFDQTDRSQSQLAKQNPSSEEHMKDLDEPMDENLNKAESTVQDFEDPTLLEAEDADAAPVETDIFSMKKGKKIKKVKKPKESDWNETSDPLIAKGFPPDINLGEGLDETEATVLDSKQPSTVRFEPPETNIRKGKKEKKKGKKAQAFSYNEISETPSVENLDEPMKEDPNATKAPLRGPEDPTLIETELAETDMLKFEKSKKDKKKSKKARELEPVQDSSKESGIASKELVEELVSAGDNADFVERSRAVDEEPESFVSRKGKKDKKKAKRTQINHWSEEPVDPQTYEADNGTLELAARNTSSKLPDEEACIVESQETVINPDDIESISLNENKRESREEGSKPRDSFRNEVPIESRKPTPDLEFLHGAASLVAQEADDAQETWEQSSLNETSSLIKDSSPAPTYGVQGPPQNLSDVEVELSATFDRPAEPLGRPIDQIEADSYFSIDMQGRDEALTNESISSTQVAQTQDQTLFEPMQKDGPINSRVESLTPNPSENTILQPFPVKEQVTPSETDSVAMAPSNRKRLSRGADPRVERSEPFQNSENVANDIVALQDIALPSEKFTDSMDEPKAFPVMRSTSFADPTSRQEQFPADEFEGSATTERENPSIREAQKDETHPSSTYMVNPPTYTHEDSPSLAGALLSETTVIQGQVKSETDPLEFEHDPRPTQTLDSEVTEDRSNEADEFAEYSTKSKKKGKMSKKRQPIIWKDETVTPAIVEDCDNAGSMGKARRSPASENEHIPDALFKGLNQEPIYQDEPTYQDITQQTRLQVDPDRTDELYLAQENMYKPSVMAEEPYIKEIKNRLNEQKYLERGLVKEQMLESGPTNEHGLPTIFKSDRYRTDQSADPLFEREQDRGLGLGGLLSASDKDQGLEGVEEQADSLLEIPTMKKSKSPKKQRESSVIMENSQPLSSQSSESTSEDTSSLPLSSTQAPQAKTLGNAQIEEPTRGDQEPSSAQLHDGDDTRIVREPIGTYDFPVMTKKGKRSKKSKKQPWEQKEDLSTLSDPPRTERDDYDAQEIGPSMSGNPSIVDPPQLSISPHLFTHQTSRNLGEVPEPTVSAGDLSASPPKDLTHQTSRNLEEIPEPTVSAEDSNASLPKDLIETVAATAAIGSGIAISEGLHSGSGFDERLRKEKSIREGKHVLDLNEPRIVESSAMENETVKGRTIEQKNSQDQGEDRGVETIEEPSSSTSGKLAYPQSWSAENEKSIYRDSGVHISDSPLLPENPPIHYSVRDSGYQPTEESPTVGIDPEIAGEKRRSGRETEPLDEINLHKADRESFRPSRKGSHHVTEDDGNYVIESSNNPLNISIEVDPTYEVSISQPDKAHIHTTRFEQDVQATRELSQDEGEYPVTPSKSSMYLHEHVRQPSPVTSTSKDRSSVLFQSSPSTRDDGATYGPQHPDPAPYQTHHVSKSVVTPSNVQDLPKSHDTSVFQTLSEDSYRGSRQAQPTSLFGGPIGINSDSLEKSPSPSTPLDIASSNKRKLKTINEYSPEESPLHKKSRDISDVGLPEHALKAARRSATPQSFSQHRIRSPLSKESGKEEMISTDDILSRLSWPAVDEEKHVVDLDRSLSRDTNSERRPSNVSILTADLHKHHDADKRSVSGASIRSGDSIHAIIRTPDQVRSVSGLSNRSSGTPPLRRVDRSISGDLRGASKRSEAKNLANQAEAEKEAEPVIPSSSTYDPITDKGKSKSRIQVMTDVYEGWGDVHGSPRSPTRPPSMRRRQSMQILDLETRLDQLVSENRLLLDAKSQAERNLKNAVHDRNQESSALNDAIQTRDLYLKQKDSELNELREILDGLQHEVSNVTEVNEGLMGAREEFAAEHQQRYNHLESEHATTRQQWQESTRELDELRQQHSQLSTGMEGIVRHEINVALEKKNVEIRELQTELLDAREQVRALQKQILAAKPSDDLLTNRDEDYFDNQSQQLCQHVQQWVLRFSKFSDMRACRYLREVSDEKIADRFDNAILDGSDVDTYLADRVKRRDVFMSVVMNMVWEYVFTRYLFGMDREQRQKLKSLEKTLGEVGPPTAVNKWRATTLMMLSRRDAFLAQRAQDTEAVVQEIFDTLAVFLPPPSHLENQIQESLRNVLRIAVDLSIEMRTQRAEYIMLPPIQPEFDINGDLANKVYFNASVMNERSGDTTSNEELAAKQAVVRMVLFPLVVKQGDDQGIGDERIVVCPAQVLVAKEDEAKGGKKGVRVTSAAGNRMEGLSVGNRSVQSFAPSSMDAGMGMGGMI